MNDPIINNLLLKVDVGIINNNIDYIKEKLIKLAIYIINETYDFSNKYVIYKDKHPYLLVPCKNIHYSPAGYNMTPDKAIIINPLTNEKNIITLMNIIDRIKSKSDLIEMYYEIELFFNYYGEVISNLI